MRPAVLILAMLFSASARADDSRALILADLAASALAAGKTGDAIRHAESSIAILTKDHPADDPILLRPLELLSACFFEAGMTAKARDVYRKMLLIRPETPKDHGMIHIVGAVLYQAEDRPGEAETELLAALHILEDARITSSGDYLSALMILGSLYIEQKRYGPAREVLRRADTALATAADVPRVERMKSLTTLGVVCVREGDWPGAEDVFRRGLEIASGEPWVNPSVLHRLLVNYAVVLRKTHRRREARAMEARARALGGPPMANGLVDISDLRRARR